MKTAAKGILLLWVGLALAGWAPHARGGEKPEKGPAMAGLLPGDDRIAGWKRSGKGLEASREEDFYRLFNGGAVLYLRHGLRSFVGQSYQGPKGLELEAHIFDLGSPQNARQLYQDPFNQPARGKEVESLGEKARIDETPLFGYGVEFIGKGFFVRVVVEGRTEEGLRAALAFARAIAGRIE